MAGSEQFHNITVKRLTVIDGGTYDGPLSPTAQTTLDGKLTATKGAAVANATVAVDGTSAGTQLNALLAALRAAGIINT